MRFCLDACVLYPTVLREILMGVAGQGLFTPLWSARIAEEWRRTAERQSPGDGVIAAGEIALLNARWPEAEIPADPELEQQLWLPDSGDIHVLATAIKGQATGIVTLNLRDFPTRELQPHNLQALHPDALLYKLWQDSPDAVTDVVTRVQTTAQSLAGEPLELRKLLKRARLPRLGKALSYSW
ncbi:RSP_2648 family PIN domain-containing protein [Nioella aestuarii]|uniref:RSP_2648 family PIN domain-containing protein n=1 Tax=Nioella aestuarii TaxID=1662864 RepID=UPI003D7FCEF4